MKIRYNKYYMSIDRFSFLTLERYYQTLKDNFQRKSILHVLNVFKVYNAFGGSSSDKYSGGKAIIGN